MGCGSSVHVPKVNASDEFDVADDAKDDNGLRVLKLVLVGDAGTGKTSFMKRAVHNCFTAEHDDAAQVKIEHIMHQTKQDEFVTIELWDMPSREDYDTRDVSYTGIGASLVMVDLTNLQTLDNARLWRTDTLAVAREDEAMAARRRSMRRQTIADDFVTWGDEGGSRDVTSADAPAYLVATKADMIGTVDEMNALVQECEQVRDTAGFNGLLIVSAKDDMRHSVKKAIDSVAAALCASDDYAQEAAANAKAAAKAGANAA